MSLAPSGPQPASTTLGVPDPRIDVVHDGYTVLVTRSTGELGENPDQGLFDFDCRVLSWWRLAVGGAAPGFVSTLPTGGGRWGSVLRVPGPHGGDEGPRLPQDGLEVRVTRQVGCGMVERVFLANHSMAPRASTLRLELGATFGDVVEPPTPSAPQRGKWSASWADAACEVRFEYDDTEGERRVRRGLRVTLAPGHGLGTPSARAEPASRPKPLETGAREVAMAVTFPLVVPPRGTTSLELRYASFVDGAWREPSGDDIEGRRERHDEQHHDPSRRATTSDGRAHEAWQASTLARGVRIESANPSLDETLLVAHRDLLELRNRDLAGDADDDWLPNAGVPGYTGVFGRDSVISGAQALLFGPAPAAGALRWITEAQGRTYDEPTEEQPGRMLHELRRGPMADLHRIPQHRFYGAHTTSTLFPWLLAEHWLWTGDRMALERYLPAARRAIEWATRDGDSDGDGFLEYAGTAPGGLRNEAWKDSGEAVRYPDGRLVVSPIATVEEQAFHLQALECTAALLTATGADEESAELLDRARALRSRWHDAYWMEREGWYALALDPDKRQVRAVASNPGHGLATGIVPVGVSGRVAARLLREDLFSGWGVRTLSSDHPSYNPLSYHLGSVWPFENAMFAAGLRAYGFDDAAEQLTTALLTAAAHFRESRLPELFGGHARDDIPVPTVYADSNVTQAWTASAMASLIQTMLGIRPLAPLGLLALVRPRLPAWLPWLTVHRLRVGGATVSLRFERDADGRTRHEVLSTTGELEVRRTDDPPGDAGPGGELVGLLDGHERLVRAVRTRLVGTRDA